MQNYNFVEFVNGNLKVRNNILDVQVAMARLKESNKHECYSSFYRYPLAMVNHVKETGSVTDYDGEVWSDAIWIDIDNLQDTEQARKDTIKLYTQLLEKGVPETLIEIYFTGYKGFNLTIPTRLFSLKPSSYLSSQVKHIVLRLADTIPIDTTIYDKTRVIRIPNTINDKSGLYKITIAPEELKDLSIDEIRDLAKSPREEKFSYRITSEEEGKLVHFLEGYKGFVTNRKPVNINLPDEIKSLWGQKLCLHTLLTHGVEQGERSNACIRLASDFVKKGYSESMIQAIMLEWLNIIKGDSSFNEHKIISDIKTAFNGCYDYGCNDPLLAKYCNPRCFLRQRKDRQSDDIRFWKMEDIAPIYVANARDVTRRRFIIPCLPDISKAIRWNTGEVLVYLGRTGTGKSLLLQNTCHHVATVQNTGVIMFSLEMPKELCFERGMSIESGWSTEAIEQFCIDNEERRLNEYIKRLQNLYIVDRAGLTIEQIEDLINKIDGVRFVGIDYMTLVRGEGRTQYEKISNVAVRLKEVAKNTDCAIMLLAQLNRTAGEGNIPVSLTMARDSGMIEECADSVLGGYEDAEEEGLVIVDLLKNRKGKGKKAISEYIMLLGESVKMVSVDKSK
jgi:hypothetical protein